MLEVPDLGYKPTIGECLRRAAADWPDKDFIVMPEARITFAQAERASRSFGKRLVASGLGKGARVGIYDTYSIEWVIVWLAATRIGALVMPFSSIYKPAELRTVLRVGDVHTLLAPAAILGRPVVGTLEEALPDLAGARAPYGMLATPFLREIAIWGGDTGGDVPAWARQIEVPHDDAGDFGVSDALFAAIEAEVVPADLAQVTYTSGSSALPKGVVHSHGAIVRSTGYVSPEMQKMMAAAAVAAPADLEPKTLCGFPFFWIGGTLILGMAMQKGMTMCVLEKFEPGPALDMIERERCTVVHAWPSLIQSLKAHPSFASRDLSSIPSLTQGPSDMAILNTPVPGVPGHRSMSELVGNWNGSERKAVADASTGEPLPDLEEGELWVRGFGLMQGYYKKEREETFDENGWLHTGDKVFMYENRPFFLGRFYEMIKSQGANVSPREVELYLEQWPEIEHALVFGMPHPTLEEEVVAVIVFKPGATMTPDEIGARARKEISGYKVPTRIEIVEDGSTIPWLGSGKPDKLALRARLLERSPS